MYSVKIAQGLDNITEAGIIRNKVFVQEQGFVNEFDDIDASAYHVVVMDGNKAAATGRIYSKNKRGKVFIIGRVAVLKEMRKHNLGSLVMKELEKQAQKLNAEFVELSAQVSAKGFYEKLGYSSVGGEFLEENVPHILMQKQL